MEKESEKNWSAEFKNPILFYLASTVLLARFFYYHGLLKTNTKTEFSYRIRSTFLALTSLVLLPFVLILMLIIGFWELPNWYHTHNSSTGRMIRIAADFAVPKPSQIEGLGPMGCLRGLLFISIFVFVDYLLPFLARDLFIPFAIIIGTIGFAVEPIWRTFIGKRK